MQRTHARAFIVALALGGSLGLVGCSDADDSGLTESAPPPETAQPAPESGADDSGAERNDDADAPLDDVTRAALAGIDLAEADSGGQAFQIDDEDDQSAWEIDINVQGEELDVLVNWGGTEIVSSMADGSVDSDTLERLGASTLTIQEAIRIAGAEASGSLEEAELDREDGVTVWEVTFGDGSSDTDVRVDAATGEVLAVDTQ